MNEERYISYLFDLMPLLKEQAINAKLAAAKPEPGWEHFNQGELMGYHAVFSLLKNLAAEFHIDESEINLADIDPDRDLLVNRSVDK